MSETLPEHSGCDEFHFAICERDDCPWKFRGVTAEATDQAARDHCVVAGHDVTRREETQWRVM